MTRLNKGIKVGNSNTTLERLIPYILYDNASGENGDITLSDNVNNYQYIEIYYRDFDSYHYYTRVYAPNGKNVSLILNYANNTDALVLKIAQRTILNNKIKTIGSSEININNGLYQTNQLWTDAYITKVIGYK